MPPPPQNPQSPQNPYGAPPPPSPGPYGQQPPPPPGPYGQQPPVPPGPQNTPHGTPYGNPYAQAPYPPQPQGWGVPPMGPPPKKRRVGLIVGIVGGVVGLIVIGGVVLALIGNAVGSGFPEAKNKLTLPKTLIDGRFELAQDLSGSEGRKIEDEADGAWDAKDVHAVVGQYSQGGDQTQGALVISGMYGRLKNTDKARRDMLKGATEADGVTLAAGPKDFPQSGEPTVSCEVLTQEKLGTTITYPACAWTDENTGAMVASMTAKTLHQDPSEVDLAFYAKLTRQVRAETVKPLG